MSNKEQVEQKAPHDDDKKYTRAKCLKPWAGLFAVCSLCLYFVHFVLGVTFFEWEQEYTKKFNTQEAWFMYTEEHHAFLVSVKAIAGLSLILFVLQIIHLIKVCKQKYDDSHEMFHNYDSLYKLVSVLTYIVFWAWFFCIIVFISSSLSEHWKQYLKFKYSEGAVKNFGKDWCKDDNRWLCKQGLIYFSVYYFSIFALFTQFLFTFGGHVMGYFAVQYEGVGNKKNAFAVVLFLLCIFNWLGHEVCIRLFLLFNYAPIFQAPTDFVKGSLQNDTPFGVAWRAIWHLRATFDGFYRGLGYTEVTLLIMIVFTTLLLILQYSRHKHLFYCFLGIGSILYIISWCSVVGLLASDQDYQQNQLMEDFNTYSNSNDSGFCTFRAQELHYFENPIQYSANWLTCRRGQTYKALYAYSIYICIAQFIFFFIAVGLSFSGAHDNDHTHVQDKNHNHDHDHHHNKDQALHQESQNKYKD